MKKLLLAVAVAATVLLSSTVMAKESTEVDSESGWFVGASIGSIESESVDEIESYGFSVDNTYKVMYGYHFNEYLALEQAWNNFGNLSGYGQKITTKGLTTEVVVSLPINSVFKPFFKAGLNSWFVESDYFSDSGSDLIYGAGITVSLGNFDLTLEHQSSDGLGFTSTGVKYNF